MSICARLHCARRQVDRAVGYFVNAAFVAAVMALTPVAIVGSASGAKRGECKLGKSLPLATLAGSTAPSQKMKLGIFSSVRL